MVEETIKKFQFLDETGLKTLIAKIKETYATKDEILGVDVSEQLKEFAKTEEIKELLKDYAKNEDVTEAVNNAIAEVIGEAPEAFDTLKEIADWIAKHGDVEDITTSIADIEKDVETLTGEMETTVKYQKFVANGAISGERKTIQLANNDSISGIGTDGNGYNLVMLSQWDVADFGSAATYLNLNSKERPTFNDGKAEKGGGKLALVEDFIAIDEDTIENLWNA